MVPLNFGIDDNGSITGDNGFRIVWSKYDKVVFLYIYQDNTSLASNVDYDVTTLPASLKPKYYYTFAEENPANKGVFTINNETGKITFKQTSGVSSFYMKGTTTFITA